MNMKRIEIPTLKGAITIQFPNNADPEELEAILEMMDALVKHQLKQKKENQKKHLRLEYKPDLSKGII